METILNHNVKVIPVKLTGESLYVGHFTINGRKDLVIRETRKKVYQAIKKISKLNKETN